MTKAAFLIGLLVTVLVYLLPAAPAQAQAIRTFVSVAGSDSNPCSITQPCRHFQAAVNATALGGEVDALDPGAYGSFTISHAITIQGQGWSYVAPPMNSGAITINAGPSDKVDIHGVLFNGINVSMATGILFNSGASLSVKDCTIQNFNLSGIIFQPNASTSLSVADTVLTDNGFAGIQIRPSGSGTVTIDLNRVEVRNNNNLGIEINALLSSGGSITGIVSESDISDNGGGIAITSTMGQAVAKVTLFHSVVANSPSTGLAPSGNTATLTVAQSAVTGHAFAGWNISSSATLQTYQDNYFNGNGANVGAATNVGKL
jgi:hypothetical protein